MVHIFLKIIRPKLNVIRNRYLRCHSPAKLATKPLTAAQNIRIVVFLFILLAAATLDVVEVVVVVVLVAILFPLILVVWLVYSLFNAEI